MKFPTLDRQRRPPHQVPLGQRLAPPERHPILCPVEEDEDGRSEAEDPDVEDKKLVELDNILGVEGVPEEALDERLDHGVERGKEGEGEGGDRPHPGTSAVLTLPEGLAQKGDLAEESLGLDEGESLDADGTLNILSGSDRCCHGHGQLDARPLRIAERKER